MRYETLIGWRYLFRRKRNPTLVVLFVVALAATLLLLFLLRGATLLSMGPVVFGSALAVIVLALLLFFSVFTTVAILGVTMGVTALVVVLSVTSGFQEAFKDKVLGVNAHVIVMKWGPDFSEYAEVGRKATAQPGVRAAAPFVFQEIQIARGTAQTTVLIKGIDPPSSLRVLDVGEQIVEGGLDDFVRPGPGILIGRELAKKLRAHVGDRVTLLPPLATVEPSFLKPGTALAQSGEFRVAGIFYAGFDEYDRRLVYVKLGDAQRLAGKGDVVSGVEIKLADSSRASATAHQLERVLGGAPYRIIDWEELNHNLFTALRLQKFVISLFLTIIVVVAAFNIVASLTLIVLSKRKEIAILKSMGVKASGVARIFQVAGLTIGAVGVLTGIGFGLLLCTIASHYGYPLDPKIYLISQLPVHVRPIEVVVTAVVTLAICLLATLYPSAKASRLHPVEGLRAE